jgi:acyl dehydratase
VTAAPTVLEGLDDVRAAVGRDLGTTAWIEVTVRSVELFTRATSAEGPRDGGIPVVPPEMVLALTNLFLPQLVVVEGVSAGVNYGTEQVRYGAALPVASRVRARAELTAADEVPGGVQTTIRITVEAEGTAEAVCVVDSLSRWLA